MPYTIQTWADLPDQSTPITASRLSHIETGIFNAAATADLGNAVSSVNSKTGAVVLVPGDIAGAETTTGSQTKATAAQTAAIADAATKYIPLTQRGAVNGVATLGPDGTLTTGQYPSGAGVLSINGLSGAVTLGAADIGGATPSDISNAIASMGYVIFYSAGAWPNRSTATSDATKRVTWVGGSSTTPPSITGTGATGAVNDRDKWEYLTA